MSIKIMSMVFKDPNLDSTKKLIMLSLADNANDEGFCYPSLLTIARKTSLSKKTVIKHIRELVLKNLLLTKQRSKKNGGRYSSIYIVYPLIFTLTLEQELQEKFDIKNTQSVEATPPTQSVEATPQTTAQSVEATPKPSLTLFNHHLFNKLNKEEKDLFLEYLSVRKNIKLQTTLKIQDKLLRKYFAYGRKIEIFENAIISNWKNFYPISKKSSRSVSNLNQKNEELLDKYFPSISI